MPSVAELQVVVGADTSAAEGKLSSFGSGLGAALGVGVAAAGAAIAAGVAVGVKAAGDLEQSVANISTIKPEIDTSAVFASLSEMSTRIPQTAAELGTALYDVFSSVNVSQAEGIQLVETFAKGAVGAQTDAQTFGTAVMGVMNAYSLGVADAGHISDVFFNTVKNGVVTGEELAQNFGVVTQSAKLMGVDINVLGAMIAGVTKEGGPAAQNINNLNNLLQKMGTKEAAKGFGELGISVANADGSMRPVLDVLGDLKTATGAMTAEAANLAIQKIFPDAQARTGAIVMMSQLDFVRAAVEENINSVGAAESAYTKMSATFNSQSALLMNGLTAVLTTVGAMLLPMITPLVTAFSTSLPAAFAAAQASLAPFVAAFLALGPSVMAVVQIVSDAWGTLVQVFTTGWAPDASIQPFVNALGMVAIVVRDQVIPAVMALLAIDYAILTAVGSFIVSQFQVVVSWFQANWPLIQQTVATVAGAIEALWSAHGAAILTVIQSAWTVVQTITSTSLAVLLGLITATMAVITGDWTTAWTALQGVLEAAWAGYSTIVQAAATAILAVIQSFTGIALADVVAWTTGTTAAIAEGGTSWLESVTTAWTGITTATETSLAAVGTAISTGFASFLGIIQAAVEAERAAVLAVWNLIPADIQADLILISTHLVTAGAAWLASIVASTAAMLAAFVAWAAASLAAFTAWATATTAAITAWAAATIAAITAWAVAFLAPITALVAPATAAADSIGTGILTGISTKVAEALAAVVAFGASVLSTLGGLVASAGAEASAIGAAIVAGIASGISSAAQSLASAAANVVRGALQAARNAIDAKSPSMVFRAEVGVPMVDGIILGVEERSGALNERMAGLVGMALGTAKAAIGTVATMGAALVSASTDALGNVTRIFTEGGIVVGATITNTAGLIVNAWGTMAAQVTTQTQTLGDAVIATTVQTGTKLVSETTNALGVTVARYRETNGQIVTIVTDQNNKVVADFTQAASKIGAATDTQHTKLISSTTDALGRTIEIYREKTGQIVTLMIDASGKIVKEFTAASVGAVKSTEGIKEFQSSVSSIKPPDLSSTVKQFDSVRKAAEKALDAVKDINSAMKGGSKSGGGNNPLGKAGGGPVSGGQTYEVGERGRELFTPFADGYITPNHLLAPSGGGGGGGVTETHVFVVRDPSGRTLEEWFITGQNLAARRGRT